VLTLVIVAVLAADGGAPVPGVEAVQLVEVPGGGTAVPGSLVPVADGFVLAWVWQGPTSSECYLTRLTASGHSVARKRVAVEGCEGVRAAWSGRELGLVFRYRAQTPAGEDPSRGGFQRYDAALEPLGPPAEVVAQPASWGTVAWNPASREWGVGWVAFAPRPGTSRLARFGEDGRRFADVELAPGRLVNETSLVSLVDALAPWGHGFVAALSQPLRLVRWAPGLPKPEVVAIDDEGWHGSLLLDGALTRVLWRSRGSTVLRVAKVEGAKVKEKALVRELSTDFGTDWASLHCPAAPRALWHEHHSDGSASQLLVARLDAKKPPARVDPQNDALGAQRYPLGLCTPQGLLVVFGRFDKAAQRDRLFLVRVP
jgi:hypothetical protein